MTVRSSTLRQNPAYRPGNPLLILVLLVLAALACRGPVPEQTVSVPRPVVAPVAEVPRAWILRPGFVGREYHIEQRAQVSTTSDSGRQSVDSTSVSVDASVRNVSPAGIAGLIRAALVGAPGAGAAALPGLVVPYAFTGGDVRPGTQSSPAGRSGSADPCSSPAQIPLAVIREVLVRAPDSVAIGREWSDSGTYVTCREGVRIDVVSRRRFRISAYERRDGGSVLIATRSGTTSLLGMSVRGDDTTRVDGSGNNVLRYELDAVTGHVVSASGTGTVDITVRGARKSQRAHQTSALQIALRTP